MTKRNILLVTWRDGSEVAYGMYTDAQAEEAVNACRNMTGHSR